MQHLRCPQCQTTFDTEADEPRVCPACGFGGGRKAERRAAGLPTITDGYSVASLVLALLAPFGALFAIVFGVVGVVHVGKHPELKGRGLAIAGIVIGVVRIAIVVVALVFLIDAVQEAIEAFREAMRDAEEAAAAMQQEQTIA